MNTPAAWLGLLATLALGTFAALLVGLMRPPQAGARRLVRALGWRDALLLPLAALLVLASAGGGLGGVWGLARHGVLQGLRDAQSTGDHLVGLKQHLDDRHQPSITPPMWLELQMRDARLPLQLLEPEAVEAWQRGLAEQFRIAPPLQGQALPAGQCQYRLWNPQGGDETRPLLVYQLFSMATSNSHHAAAVGVARAAGGGLVELMTPNSSRERRSPFLSAFFFDRSAKLVPWVPQGRPGEVEPADPGYSGDTHAMALTDPLTLADWGRAGAAWLRHVDGERFELRLDTPDGPLLRTAVPMPVRLASNELERERAREGALQLARVIQGPEGAAGSTPFPVELDVSHRSVESAGRIEALFVRLRGGPAADWWRDHPDGAGARGRLVLWLDEPTLVDLGGGRGFAYRTNHRLLPRLVGRLRCGQDPPQELGPFKRWLDLGALGY